MNHAVAHQRIDEVAVLTIDNPPVNTLSADVRARLGALLQRAEEDPEVQAVVIAGSVHGFSGGAEVREFNTPRQLQSPTLPELNAAQDRIAKPLIAAISKFAFGAGLELALACHWRIASPASQLGLPEVRIGLLPGSGGTQRLPRVVPMDVALRMMTTGDPVSADEARRIGLVDEIIFADLVPGAVEFAKALIARGAGVRRVREMPVRADGDVVRLLDETRSKLARIMKGQPAPLAIVDCCEAAVMRPFDEARAFERESFLRLLHTTESKALRHVFFAERQAAKIPDVPPETPTRAIERVAVVGAGLMGCGIAMSLANAGLPVALIDTHTDALDRGLSSIRANYAATVAKGRLTQDEMHRRIGHIQASTTLDAASNADVIIEAVFERMDVKHEIFRALDTIAKPGAILATNTSTLDIEAIADVTTRPEDVVGMHFFSPANVMRLLEVVRCSKTADDVLATAMQLGKRLGKVAVVSGVCDGFIGNRMLQKYAQQSLFLIDEGCTPAQIDRAMTDWGMAMGPFAVGDLAGLDIGWAIRQRRRSEGSSIVYSAVADRICEAGRLGQKTGKGWYRYEAGSRTPIADPETGRIIDAYRKEIGIAPRAITSEEIVERMVYALVNEGAAILDERIALRASDIDIVYLTGYGFPAHRGGPMFHADSVGLDTVTAAIERCSKGYHGEQWTLSPLLARLAATGGKFNN